MKRVSFLAILCLVGISSANAQNLLVNPSFENPAISSGSAAFFGGTSVIGAGWFHQSGSNSVIISNGYANGGPIWPGASQGNQYLYMADSLGSATVYQDLNLDASTSYSLRFDMANFNGSGGSGARLFVDILQGGGGSTIGGTAQFDRPALGGYAEQLLNFSSLGAGTYRLTMTSANGYGTNVDNFRLTAASSAPEPGTLLLAVPGLFLLKRFRHRA